MKHICRILCALFCAVYLLNAVDGGGISAAASLDVRSISVTTEHIGNIFFEGEEQSFLLRVKNPDSNAQTVTLNITVQMKDVTKNELVSTDYGFHDTITLKGNETYIKGFVTDIKEFGVYQMAAEVSNVSLGKAESVLDFSIVPKNYGGNGWSSVQFHVGDIPDYENLDANLHLATSAGMGRSRDDVRWLTTEESYGVLKLPSWRRDSIDKVLRSGQQSPIYILGTENQRHTGGNYGMFPHDYDPEICPKAGHSCTPDMESFDEQVAAHSEFCAYMAEQLKGTKPVFEIGNEIERDNGYEWLAFRPSGEQYAKLLKSAYEAIKKVDPDATVLTQGGCSLWSKHGQEFAKQMLSVNGITKYMDGFSTHPYYINEHIDEYADEKIRGSEYDSELRFGEQIDWLADRLKQAEERDGTKLGTVKIWLTEYGATTGGGVSELVQGVNDVRATIISRSRERVECLSIYNIVQKGDADATDGNAWENGYGITRKDYTAKPAYVALSAMNALLHDTEYKDGAFEKSYSGNRTFSAYGFQRENEFEKQYIYVLWKNTLKNADGSFDLTHKESVQIQRNGEAGSAATIVEGETNKKPQITVSSDSSVKVYDWYGNEVTKENSDIYELDTTPLYVVSTIKAADKTVNMLQNGNTVTVEGRTDKKGMPVTLLAVRENSLSGAECCAIEQQISDTNGAYKFTFTLPEGDENAYSVYVYDGKKSLAGRNAPYADYKISYLVNGKSQDDLSGVKAEDEVKVRLTFAKADESANDLMFYGAIYKGGKLLGVDSNAVTWNGNIGEVTADIDPQIFNSADEMHLFLWDNELRPVVSAYTLKKITEGEK